MTIKLICVGVILGVAWDEVVGSVAGLTYMDDYDFEQRYRNVHECDPFYWHPLHLPEECADMYEKLIRSRLPVRFAKLRSNKVHRPLHVLPNLQNFGPISVSQPIFEVDEEVSRELTPYEEMLASVQKDVNNFPSVPSVKDMPNFGPVALYQQPVSQITANMIKNVATTYIDSLDDKDTKRKRHRSRKNGSKWKEMVKQLRHRERKGWKKINNGDIVSLSKP